MLEGKKILLGISGSIAAYKSILLVRLLVKQGAQVKIVMTPAAKQFVSALTLTTLSKNQVLTDLADESTWANHVMLGRWADVMIVAPASCNTMAKMASGICDNLLLATYLSCTCPVVIAPAMDEDMWHHPSTKSNIAFLEKAGNTIISVNKGELASGLFGEGRMAEPEEIIRFIKEKFFRSKELAGFNALITAGPTYEALDPVRFIGNHSSGKMGIALADVLYEKGADVHLILGPVEQAISYKGMQVTRVVSAADMYDKVVALFADAHVAILAAAVADYTPAHVSTVKIKKNENDLHLSLNKTKDILKAVGEKKSAGQLLVGFALETDNEEANALKKLQAKNADLVVLNSLRDASAGFGKDTNKVTIFDKDGSKIAYEAKSKRLVATDIVELIIQKFNAKK